MDIPRVCATCQHFRFSPGERGYSEYTPGSDCGIYCLKHHWEIDTHEDTEETYRAKQLTALTCPDYLAVASEAD